MSHHHHGLGPFLLVSAIAFAFGKTAAQVVVASALIICLAAFAYVAFRIVMGTI